MSIEAKKYFIPVNGKLVEVSEELYRAYYRPIWNTRYHAHKNGECCCTKAQLWKCDGVCPGCPFNTAGKKVSLETVIGGEDDDITLQFFEKIYCIFGHNVILSLNGAVSPLCRSNHHRQVRCNSP